MTPSSMDDQFAQMQIFHKELREFNGRLMASWFTMKSHHDRVDPLWQDNMRREYDQYWEPLKEQMEQYLRSEADRFVDFLDIKIHALRRYLYGG